MKRLVALILAISMLFSMAVVTSNAASPEVTTQLAKDIYLHQNSFYSNDAEGDINENYIVYTPNTDVTPYLVHGNDVAGAASMKKILGLEQEAGNTLVCGINGDYFNTANGIPLGIEIKDGEIKSSSHSTFLEVGFFEDGKAIIGRSNLEVKLVNKTSGTEIEYINWNKALSTSSGPVLFSSAFEDTNRANSDTINVAISVESGKASPNGTISGRVIRPAYTSSEKLALKEGEIIFSVLADSNYDVQEKMNSFALGDKIEISFNMDKAWNSVTQALGAKESLVESGKEQKFSDGTRAPRTAIGTKADGTVVVYTCDGRDYGGSKGLSLTELARRMVQLGCKTAVNLDGGASTQVHVAWPGRSDFDQVNEDAGSTLRSCGNYLCFKNNTKPTGIPVQLYSYPTEVTAISGVDKTIEISARDANWHAMAIAADKFSYKLSSDDLGSINAGVFSAGSKKMDGTLTATVGTLSIDIPLHVLTEGLRIDSFETYDNANTDLNFVHNGKKSLKLESGDYYTLTKTFTDKLPTMLSVWAMGDISGLYLDYVVNGNAQSIAFEDTASASWTRLMLNLLDGATELTGIGYSGGGTVYLDQVMVGFGNYIDDEAPEISVNFTDDYILATIKDDIDEKIEKSDIKVLLDGVRQNFTFAEDTGVVTAALPAADGKLHHLIVSACDESGNMARASVSVQIEPEEETSHEYIFADLNQKNWSTDYVEYLYERGVINGSEKNGKLYYNPTKNMTRQEFAKVITSWYGADLDSFAEVELNFTDASQIADWAVPYVKAALALGMMNGKGTKFDPNGSITRQEVMTVIGRIMERGYEASNLSQFSDRGSVDSWALPYVQTLVEQKVITGSNGKLMPKNPVTREQVAKIIFEIN